MKNNKIKIFEIQQIQKSREMKKDYNIKMTEDKFYTGDVVNVELSIKDAKGEIRKKKYIDGVVIKGNTHKIKARSLKNSITTPDFTAIDSNMNVYHMTEEQKRQYHHLRADDYITIGHFMNSTDKVSVKLRVNDPRINITLLEKAKYKSGALVRGTGRANKTKDFMEDKHSASRLRTIFKNTVRNIS